MRPPHAPWLATVVVVLLGASAAGAQGAAGVPCRGQRVDAIRIDAQAPTIAGFRRVPVVGTIVRETHVVTRDEIIRRFLLLRPGDRCSELRRAESERILRAQPFLADATVDAVSNGHGGVDLDVHTIDEASLIVSGSVGGGAPAVRSAKLGSANLSGFGVATSAMWRYHPALEDRVELRAVDYQFAGQPWVLSLGLVRDPLGRSNDVELLLPFRTDLQRLAWRTLAGETRGHTEFERRDTSWLTLASAREYLEAGAIGRLGPPGKLTLLGLSVSHERAWPDSVAERLDVSGLRPDTAAQFAGRFAETRAERVNALVGLRGIRFARVRGFDALRGTQDVPIGLQLGALVGHGIEAFGSSSSDVFVASDLYVGIGGPRGAIRLQLQGEGRRLRGSDRWDGLVGSGRLATYERVSDRRTRILSVEWSGTARVLQPHALSLGVAEGGLRGFREATPRGGRRGIARFDEQLYLGSPNRFGDLGLAWFADAGQLWAGDLPYGVTTHAQAALGIGVLLAVPMRSTRTWRLDLAVPLTRAPGGHSWELRLSHSDRTSFFWREPADIDAARARAVPASVYSWP